MIYLSKRHISEIKEHGVKTFPHECCGLLIGTLAENGEKTVFEIFPTENARMNEARHNRSLITPEDVMRGEKYAREKDLEVVGNYHSHPDHLAHPSQFDLDSALPVWSYIIISVQKGKAVDLVSWEMESDRSRFNEENLIERDD